MKVPTPPIPKPPLLKPARKGRRSVSDSVAIVAAVDDEVPLPARFTFRSEREREVWCEFTRARARDQWRPIDLWYLYKLVRLWCDCEETEAEIERSGRVVVNAKGTQIANPLVGLHDSQLRLQLTLALRLGLLQAAAIGPQAADPREIAAAALAQARMRKAIDDVDDLIPRS